ncbi:SDR family oxidoreductase [Mycobacterium sp. CBMA293]|uniref:SDR family oxidoreductase n=1 Tax=unclassified Mycolicibacterium TaxID=2636767 RepID=UPI0012DE2CD3|nr:MULTISPECIES: SDR family oxidoreductase [unclassified Mycolicibacterium]MUL45614.1 SDR family oxidoreductase [Mycolicibacterium sp. CBMA 360]MUL60284.1 SDR family oxidoreductase [Mycolicibacterium sp. CBMA 335]MUL71504.1 SDR family oxidoreductase [Mycolicibacterium sp. CBMA 311]MUL73071.1 SDR family oxidoreductase [Mycolicibacterium sp. CBMA 311]MUL95954.1 SDR family oxidoreductase [Mycolicibacterium sp. CBMA 230]
MPIDGATVIVTGGARGIGAKTAELFSQHGANVWIGDVDADIAEQTARAIPRCHSARLDVTRRDSWDELVGRVLKESGRIDILVNNAGVMPLGAFESEAETTTDLILDVNVRGVLNGMRAVIPQMVARGNGHVVNVASMAGMIPVPGMVTYNASKFAAVGASLAARREYAGTGVTVCAVLPSAVRTELSSGVQLGGGMPTVNPEDVARAVLNTLRTKAARTSVPGWVAPGWALVDALVPEFIQRAVRSLVDDRRALTALDPVGRSAYLDRIERQSKDHAAESDSELQA